MRKKLMRFKENEDLKSLIGPSKPLYESIKGKWNKLYFHNDNPIVVEIGAGRGEYTVGLAQKFPEKNFIAVDLKGDRLWHGAKISDSEELHNAAFLRARVERIELSIAENEIDEIWITFPGPRPKNTQANRRLTNDKFLDIYKRILKPRGIVHLKTDSDFVFDYTLEILRARKDITDLKFTNDLYSSEYLPDHHDIQTRFEKMFMAKGEKIKYLRFSFI